MDKVKPLFDPMTCYRIELQGKVDVDWLQSFDGSLDIVCETSQVGNLSVLHVVTDQSGLIGLLRRLHGLGMTILQFWIVSEEAK